jgi:hypothetical protein
MMPLQGATYLGCAEREATHSENPISRTSAVTIADEPRDSEHSSRDRTALTLMSISYQIVTKQHGGKLKCCSLPCQGTEFKIKIPICQPNNHETVV